ncbi:unnamed protein product [Rotaria magnacalcarata]|uniref:Uncharacterized protein n=1 Tax=Rotaria magnacalcarata TaxID=392030 RepID=A0A816H0R3_9BILA|nr:unnamed protein product [Rotaria magnacalcarata]CAF1680618.1 unnamed protein product [Rotaria magnacalcarata]CAF2060443.1 unnamed protein product [Rotaria magnacalcarata]CAF2143724.1 unnamed protein product [Rotaria magnacalcarata]CAF2153108.1 unnamed protein product [Rotaria magnacalcarata]
MTNSHPSMDIDENDEILYEINVEVHQTKQSIYIFQHPIRPHYRIYDENLFTSARIKEKNSLVEMDLLVDTQSPNYSLSKGKQFADTTNQENKNQLFNSDRMDKQTIASSNASDGDRYFVGIFDSTARCLTLCPLKSIIQFRPQFPYLDVPLTSTSGLTSNKETNLIDDEHNHASDGEHSGSESEENKPGPVGSLVTMKFEKKESEYHKKKHLQSYNYYRQTRDSERWQDLVCIMNVHSLDAQRIRQQFLSSRNLVTATNENN